MRLSFFKAKVENKPESSLITDDFVKDVSRLGQGTSYGNSGVKSYEDAENSINEARASMRVGVSTRKFGG